MWIYKQISLLKEKRNHLLFFFTVQVIFTTCLAAQTNWVSGINIIGQEVTKEYIIRREIQHPVSAVLDTLIANEDRDRIENLGIFSHVSWDYLPKEDGTGELKYFVIESWRYLPGVVPIYSEEYGWIYSGGLIVNNFRGRDQTLSVGGEFGGRFAYGIEYSDPWIAGDHISFSAAVGKNFWKHPFLPLDVTSKDIGFGFGKYFGYTIKTQLKLGVSEQSLSDGTLYRTIAFDFEPMYDTRDLYAAPSKGVVVVYNLRQELDVTGNQQHRFYLGQSYSVFHTLAEKEKKLVVGANITGNFLFGDNNHNYFSQYIGGAETIRGWTPPDSADFVNDPLRFGKNLLMASFELRQAIIPRYSTQFGTEFGLTVIGFMDVGIAGDEINRLLQEEPMLGIGLGIRFPIAILQTLRFDYGFGYRDGKWSNPVFHFSVGHKF